MKTSKYFSPKEFERCNPPCSIEDMDQIFLNRCDALREEVGIPLIANSAYRSKEHEKSKGRSGHSAHTEGKGMDFRCTDSTTRMKIVKAALAVGFTRVGIEGQFVHVDSSDILPQDVMWTY